MEIDWSSLETYLGNSTQGRCYRDGKGLVYKNLVGGNPTHASNEYKYMSAAYETLPEQTPKPIYLGEDFIVMQDLGDGERITDLIEVWKSAESLLKGLRKANVFHGDLSEENLIIKNNLVYAIDFGWSRWLTDKPLFKGEMSDRKRIFRSLALLTI